MGVRLGFKGPVLEPDDAGVLPSRIDGGYPVIYYTRNGLTICFSCASDKEKGENDAVTGSDVFWEGATITCEDCGVPIESAYGDPEAKPQHQCPHCECDLAEVGFQMEHLATVTYRYAYDGESAMTNGFDTQDVCLHDDPPEVICGHCGEELPEELANVMRAAARKDEEVETVEVTA